MKPIEPSYETTVEWKGERDVRVSAPGLDPVDSGPPTAFGGKPGPWTPEHLFIASANACFAITFLTIAENSRLALISFSCTARGIAAKTEFGYEIAEVFLRPNLVIAEEADRFKAERLLEKAEKYCLIARSMRSKVRLAPTILVGVRRL
jgi:organic hydroperoxide reductase OsmC/OhrA